MYALRLHRMFTFGILLAIAVPLMAADVFPLPTFLPEVLAYPTGDVVALQPLVELLGCTATRNELTGEVTVARQDSTLIFSPLMLTAQSNAQAVQLPCVPMLRDQTYYVPLLPLITALKGTVQPGAPGTLSISMPGFTAPLMLPRREVKEEAASLRETNDELYVMNLDGSELRRLTYGHGDKGLPVYSADKATWVYTDGGDLYLRHAGNPLPICLQRRTNQQIACANPFLSPDGKLVVYQDVYANDMQQGIRICCIRSDGTEKRVLQEGADGLCLSPDGSTIVFSTLDGIVHLMDLTGKALETKFSGTSPLFSPDGASILYTKYDLKTNSRHSEIYQLNGPGAGTTVTQVADGVQVTQERGRFSPGGKSIVFNDWRRGICLADVDLQNIRTLVPGQPLSLRDPCFTPDEKQVFGRNNYGLYVVNTDGSVPRQLTRGYVIRRYCLWPDGKHVLFTASRVYDMRRYNG